MFKQTRAYTEILTPECVARFRALPQIKNDRKFSGDRALLLRTRFERGHFYSPDWVIARCGGKTYRINGNHSSHMLSELNGAFPQGLLVNFREFACESEEDLIVLWMQFDNPESARSNAETTHAHAQLNPELADVSVTAMNRHLNGIVGALSLRGERVADRETRSRLLHQYPDYILWASSVFADHGHVRKAGVSSAAFLTWEKDAAAAGVFWRSVCIGDSNPDCPTRVLEKFLREQRHNRTMTYASKRVVIVKSIHAWNAWRAGERTQLKMYSTEIPGVK